ncbi:MAG TPA: NUDIX hydrolase [Candidatus Baltobacteraceae bacterium]|jgi:ADP-ribose pyrophosphatase|nr:NUDIX hydrolase [Candidatus Baltobacteraceae bacterium]
MPNAAQILSSTPRYTGRVFSVRTDTIRLDGREQSLDIVEHPGSFAIAAVTGEGELVLVRQYRHAAGEPLWEIPAGTAEPDEECEAGARRELREETGYSAGSWEQLCIAYPTPGYCTEVVHLYLARNLQAGIQELDDDEAIEVRTVSLEEAWKMQASGLIVDMKTLLAMLWLRIKDAGPVN